MVKHTIICWDSAYRDFYHTVDAISSQDYTLDEVELIFVEQRSLEIAETRSRERGLPSLKDKELSYEGDMDFRVEYMGESLDEPFHTGKCVNFGIKRAQGDIISVMDGDMLLPPGFLDELEQVHMDHGPTVVNIYRHMLPEPVGVDKSAWTEQILELDELLDSFPVPHDKPPEEVSNKGPLISARREDWESIGKYDEHKIWSTAASRIGQDTTARLEIAIGRPSVVLSESIAVHPWHPIGFRPDTFKTHRMLALHKEIIEWTRKHQVFDAAERLDKLDRSYDQNKELFDEIIHSHLRDPGRVAEDPESLLSRLDAGLTKAYRGISMLLRGQWPW